MFLLGVTRVQGHLNETIGPQIWIMFGNLGAKGLGKMEVGEFQRNEKQIYAGDFLVYDSCLKYWS